MDYFNRVSRITYRRRSCAIALGPFIFAICAYLIVEEEIQSQMLGQLRALGLRESVYWISWWNIFLLLAFFNSVLGAVAARIIESVHAFQEIDFGVVFISFFALNFSLIGASFFFAAIGGTMRITSALFILTMVVAVFIPYIILGAKTMVVDSSGSASAYYNNPNPTVSLRGLCYYDTSGSFLLTCICFRRCCRRDYFGQILTR